MYTKLAAAAAAAEWDLGGAQLLFGCTWRSLAAAAAAAAAA